MKKKILIYFLFLTIFLSNGSCFIFEDCDGVRYQIKKKTEIGNSMCKYRAESIGNCYIWNDQVFLEFTDSCKVYHLSTVLDRDDLYKKYGI